MDAEGIIRSNSRLEFAQFLPENTRIPMILPRKNQVTKLNVKRAHENTYHSGTNQTLAELTRDYWIISTREENGKLHVQNVTEENQIMGPLPVYRLANSMKTFTNTAVDFSGPFLTKQGRGRGVEEKKDTLVYSRVWNAELYILRLHLDWIQTHF